MSLKSEVIILDILMKNENCHGNMQDYLGSGYPSDRQVASGSDHLTCERQLGAQQHMMDGDTYKWYARFLTNSSQGPSTWHVRYLG